MATSSISVTEGSGKNIASHSLTEDAETKEIQRININNSSGTELATSGNPLRTDPTGDTTQPVSGTVTANAGTGTFNIQEASALDVSGATVTVDTEMPAAAALQDGSSNPTVPAVGGMTHVYNGTNWDRLRGDTSGLNVSDISAGTQTNDVKVTMDGEVVSIDDNSSSITIDNTNIDNLHSADYDTGGGTDTTSAVGLAIPASGGAVAVDSNNPLPVDASGNAVPVTDNSGSLTIDNTHLTSLGGAVSGSEVQVDVVAALPSGSNTIGSVQLTDGTETAAINANNRLEISIEEDNVGIGGGTEATDDTTTHSTGSTKGKTIMAAATPTDGSVDANDIGALAMSTDRRLHTDAQIVGQDADITIADGGNVITVDGTVTANAGTGTFTVQEASALDVSAATVTVSGSGTFNVQEASPLDVSGATVTIDGAHIATEGSALGSGVLLQGDDGTDRQNVAVDATSGNLQVDVSSALPSGNNNIGNVDIASAIPAGDNNIGNVDIASSVALDVSAATVNIQEATALDVSGATVTVTDDGSFNSITAGDVAHDTADSGNPVKTGGVARQSNPSAVADGDRVDASFDDVGRQLTHEVARDLKTTQQTTINNSTSETTVLTAGGAGVFLDVYGVIITNETASNTEVEFKDATTGTTRFVISAPANDTRGFMLPPSGAHNQASANNNWTATLADAISGDVQITMMAVQNV